MPSPRGPEPLRSYIRSPRNMVGGVLLCAISVFAVWAVGDLAQGTLTAMGPAMFPRWVAVGVGACGLALIASAFLKDGPPLEPWLAGGPALVCLGMIAFGLGIRTFGFLLAAPAAMLIAGAASPGMRRHELVLLVVGMTVFCIVLFRYLLDQPIPVLAIPGTSIGF